MRKAAHLNSALELLEEGLEDEPDNPRHYVLAGQAHLELGNYARADSLWDRAVCLWEADAERIEAIRLVASGTLLDRAQRLLTEGDTVASVEALRNAYTIYDREPQPVFQMGVFSVQVAMSAASDSVRAAYVDTAVWAFREAREATRRSESLNEDQRQDLLLSATANTARLLTFQGRLLEAAEAYEELLRDYADNAEARVALGSYLAMHVTQLEDSVRTIEDRAKPALLAKVDSLRVRVSGEYDRVLVTEAARLDADQYYDIGVGLYRIGEYEEAATAFQKALELKPYGPQSLELLAQALLQAELYDTLLVVAEQLTEHYPYNQENFTVLAHAYRAKGQPRKALAALERGQALPFQLLQLQVDDGAARGQMQNRTLEAGTPIEVEFRFYDAEGNVIGTGRLSTPAPTQGGLAPFRVEPEGATAAIAGFTYRVVRPS